MLHWRVQLCDIELAPVLDSQKSFIKTVRRSLTGPLSCALIAASSNSGGSSPSPWKTVRKNIGGVKLRRVPEGKEEDKLVNETDDKETASENSKKEAPLMNSRVGLPYLARAAAAKGEAKRDA